MTAKEIARVFEAVAPIESGVRADRDKGNLGFRFGDPDLEVTGVGVSWRHTLDVIHGAIARGLNMLLLHEPELFYTNESHWHSCLTPETNPVNLTKKRLLLEHGIVVYTAHSNWDLQPEVGMQPTFAKALGFTRQLKRDIAVGVYEVGPITFEQLIERVKKAVGLERVRVQGDADRVIRTVAVGFGLMGKIVDAIQVNKADAGIFGEIGEVSFCAARDAGIPLIETTHFASETIGFRSVVETMRARLPGERFEYLDAAFPFRWA